jgi:hypothetical protein
MFRSTTKSAKFSNYDPNASKFDPSVMSRYNGADAAGGPGYTTAGAQPGMKMQITLTLTNNAAVPLTFELWYYLNSMLRVRNATFAAFAASGGGTGVNYLYHVQDGYEGIQRVAAGTDGTVGFDDLGRCVIRGAGPTPGPADPVAFVQCKEVGYASLFQASAITPFIVSWVRYTVTSDPQIDEIITWKQKSYSGGQSINTINPRVYFDPNQQQALTLDILTAFDVAIDRGLELNILAGNTVKMALFIQDWTNQALAV